MSSNNQSLAMQRIAKLVDENSFMEIGSLVTARSTDFNLTAAKAPSDGVIIGHGLIDGILYLSTARMQQFLTEQSARCMQRKLLLYMIWP